MFIKIIAFLFAFLVFVAISTKSGVSTETVHVTPKISVASSTPIVDVSVASTTQSVTPPPIATTTRKITDEQKVTTPKQPVSLPIETPKPAVVTQTPIILPTEIIPSTPPPNYSDINTLARSAIVNIFCTSTTGGLFEPLSGSGVVIDKRGVILTNAHVAQYLLLQNYQHKNFLHCIARIGSPATPTYEVKLLYISNKWVESNYSQITSQKPTGTGENDFALLQIIGNVNPDNNLPDTFSAIDPDTNEGHINTNDTVVLVGYPAGFLGGISIQRELYAVSAIVQIGKLYTFETGSLDAFSLGGSVVAQQGSSGGGAISSDGKLLGIIVTSTDAKETSGRDLDAISLAHVNRGFVSETGHTLLDFLSTDLTDFSRTFETETAPKLTKLLVDTLTKK
ncbi:MAG: trypsin-like peptidase domain-containing protein [Candidatus Taylorbacteria bacterium]|nr:trypsin-like peptidase domain-containing protein [Candidatus Taylorbacteria bacterium]